MSLWRKVCFCNEGIAHLLHAILACFGEYNYKPIKRGKINLEMRSIGGKALILFFVLAIAMPLMCIGWVLISLFLSFVTVAYVYYLLGFLFYWTSTIKVQIVELDIITNQCFVLSATREDVSEPNIYQIDYNGPQTHALPPPGSAVGKGTNKLFNFGIV